jgi:hypothetical protein
MKTRIIIGASLLALTIGTAACGSEQTTISAPAPAQTTAHEQKASKPKAKLTVMSCMKSTHVNDGEFLGGDGGADGYRVWRGNNEDGDSIRVTQLESKSGARKAAKAATELQHASGGRYAVFGPLGSQLTIKPLAHCLERI